MIFDKEEYLCQQNILAESNSSLAVRAAWCTTSTRIRLLTGSLTRGGGVSKFY